MTAETYYGLLRVAPSATSEEVAAACDAQHNHWQRLVTHHDPSVAAQAQRAIQAIETIRATLTDPVKRVGYDAGIGLGNVLGGLADPNLPSTSMDSLSPASAAIPPRPTSPRHAASDASTNTRVDAWLCPKCHNPNKEGTRYCRSCGTGLAQQCPNPQCQSIFEQTASFCPNCGQNPEEVRRQQEIARVKEAAERVAAQQRAAEAGKQIKKLNIELEQAVAEHRTALLSHRSRTQTLILLLGSGSYVGGFGSIVAAGYTGNQSSSIWMYLIIAFFIIGSGLYVVETIIGNRRARLARENAQGLEARIHRVQSRIAELQSVPLVDQFDHSPNDMGLIQ